MPQYDIACAKKLGEVAFSIAPDIGESTEETERTAAYLSLLSIEIGLKSILERAGVSIDLIRARSHGLRLLLQDVDKIKIKLSTSRGKQTQVSGSRLRSLTVEFANAATTVGYMLDAQGIMTSKYPNEIRYGDALINFPSRSLAMAALAIVSFAEMHWDALGT